ncbi:MAG: TetR/AcrR family transcriptional regulator [Pseudonocardiaceae bacterium]
MSELRNQATDRADRILDAAGALLLRLGYRKVTIQDIAEQAGIGKGTVYLHWRTREQLFQALMLRESIGLVEELLDRLREDPAEIIPHRFVPASFLATLRRPLIVALLTGDTELLGRLMDTPLRSQELLAGERFFALMTRHRLLRDDVPNLAYAMQAATTGFYLIDNLNADVADLDRQAKADALAHTIRHAFEPAAEPDPAVVAATASELSAVFEDLIASYRTWIYSHAQAPESG